MADTFCSFTKHLTFVTYFLFAKVGQYCTVKFFSFLILMFRPALISNMILGILFHDESFYNNFTVNVAHPVLLLRKHYDVHTQSSVKFAKH